MSLSNKVITAITLILSVASFTFSTITWTGMNFYPTQVQVSVANPVIFQQPARYVNGSFFQFEDVNTMGYLIAQISLTISIVSPFVGIITISYSGFSPEIGTGFDITYLNMSKLVLSVPSGAYQNTISLTVMASIYPQPHSVNSRMIYGVLGQIFLRAYYENVQWRSFFSRTISDVIVVNMAYQRVFVS